MATHHGNDGRIHVGANAVAEVSEFSVDEAIDIVEDTAQGDTAKTHLTGLTEWSGSASCWWDETDTNGQEAMGIGDSVTLNLYPEGSGAGARYMTGTATISAVRVGVPKDNVVTREIDFVGNGALTHGTVGS